MVKILQVLYTLDRGDGSANVIMNLYRHTDKSKVQFDFLYFVDSMNSFVDEIKEQKGNVFLLELSRNGGLLSLKRRFSDLLDEQNCNYTAVHLNFPLLGCLLFSVAKAKGIKYLISHSHSSSYGTKFSSKVRNFILFKLTSSMSNIHFACSKKAGSFLFGEKEMSAGKVHLIHNSVDCAKYQFNGTKREALRHEYGLKDELLIVHIGRFCAEKNHIFLLNVFAEIHKKKHNALLYLIGTGPLEESIKAKAKELGILNVTYFLGLRNDVCDLLQMMDVFVMPSLFEGLPVTLVEAQAAGLPCVVSNNVPKDSCLIPDIYKSLSLDDTLDEWCNQVIKSSLLPRQSTFNEMREQGFDIIATAQKLQSWYLSLKK